MECLNHKEEKSEENSHNIEHFVLLDNPMKDGQRSEYQS